MKSLLIIVGCWMATSLSAGGQTINWSFFENSIAGKTNFVSLQDSLQQIKQRALLAKDDITQARCWYYQLQMADLKQDDTLFFQNAFFIDSLLQANTTSPLLRSIMYVLKAKRVALFRHRFFYNRKKMLFEIPNTSIDYRVQTIAQLDSIQQACFDSAGMLSATLTKVPVQQLLWLASDPWLFLFRPLYQDIVFAEQIAYLQVNVNGVKNGSDQWLKISVEKLLQPDTLPAGLHKSLQPVYQVYRRWANSNSKNPEAFYFIESLARTFFYQHNFYSTESSLYEEYQLQSEASPYAAVRVHAVYKLALYWEQLGKKYLENNYSFPQFKPAYQKYNALAVELISTNSRLLDSFYYLKEKLYSISENIRHPELTISMQQKQLPGDSLALQVASKNIAGLRYTVIRLNSNQQLVENSSVLKLQDLLQEKPLRTERIALPAASDFQTHRALVKVPGLPTGFYAFVYGNDTLNTDDQQTRFFTFHITNIAVINNDSRVFVLNRITGKPLPGATMLVRYNRNHQTRLYESFTTTVSAEGYALVEKPNVHEVIVMQADDTISTSINAKPENRVYDQYDGEDDEDMLEFYEDEIKLHLFTDRAIYRPGQTVYYKGILMTRDPVSGKQIVLNKKNLRFPWLKKLFNKEIQKLAKGSFDLYLEDAFGKKVDTIKVAVNQYGSFSGSYVVNKKAATGDWEFDAEDIELDNRNNGDFKVEEYKRPTFDVKLVKPTNFLQLGDSFFVKVKVTSFAGAALTNVAIKYTVNANFNNPSPVPFMSDSYIRKEVLDSNGTTNAAGELLIKVTPNFLKSYQFPNQEMYSVYYDIAVTAIDASGESHEDKLKLTLDNRPVKIEAAVNKLYERNELNQLYIKTKSIFSGYFVKPLQVKLYTISPTENTTTTQLKYDYLLVNNNWQYDTTNASKAAEEKLLLYEGTVDSMRFSWPKQLLKAGQYEVVFTCLEQDKILGQRIARFDIFDKAADQLPAGENEFEYLPVNSINAGDTINWYTGSSLGETYTIFHAQYYAATGKDIALQHHYELVATQQHINTLHFTIPKNATGDVKLTSIYVRNNEVYIADNSVYIQQSSTVQPEITIAQYRKVLTPGAKETFVVNIKTADAQVAAELMTTMYDASLDKLNKHQWTVPSERQNLYHNINWNRSINQLTNTNFRNQYTYKYALPALPNKMQPLWWLNPLDYAYDSANRISPSLDEDDLNYFLAGKVSGLQITSAGSLNEMVVIGYGVNRRSISSSTSIIRIRGSATLSSLNIPLVIIDGVVYEGDMDKINRDLITDALVLKDAEATALFGARASQGVIVISTKGPVQLPVAPEVPVVVRKNFAETAFFLPKVYAGTDGQYHIQFEIPESVTEWSWKMLAHTKSAQFMYLEKRINTQLPLMVQQNMPRFLYQGDVIQLQTRITNLDSSQLSGNSNCHVEDAVTGEDISAQIIKQSKQAFTVGAKSNNTIGFELRVPTDLFHPIKIKVTANAGSFSDGEEYTIPVLSTQLLVSKNLTFVLANHADTLIQSPTLPADAALYGAAMYIQPKPQAALINALPYLANYPHNCAEQTFNKMLAHITALKIIRTDSVARQSMQQLQKSTDINRSSALPEELDEQTMPWLQLGTATSLHQRQLLQLFDSVAAKKQIEKYLLELVALQNPDGGITWFNGGQSSPYISDYLLAAFGKLMNDSFPFFFNAQTNEIFSQLIKKLIAYSDKAAVTNRDNIYHQSQYLFARRYWLNTYPMDKAALAVADTILTRYWKIIDGQDLSGQAELISTSLVFKGPQQVFYKNAMAQLSSIQQLAVSDAVNGVRWKTLSNPDDLTSSAEETISNLAMAFAEAGNHPTIINGILQWLLQAKSNHEWSNTKATAAVVGLLNKQQQNSTGVPIVLQSGTLSATDNLLAGQLIQFNQMSSLPARIPISKTGNDIAKGGLNIYYFTANPPTDNPFATVTLSRTMQRFNKTSQAWELIDSNTVLHIADQVRTTITINSRKPLQYVFIDEKRAAAQEPANGNSGYQYGDGFGYYAAVRDAGYQFFAEHIPAGNAALVYETIIAKSGTFNTGISSLQCMYQPAVKAYVKGVKVKVE